MPIYGNSGVGQPGTDGTKVAVIDLATRKVIGNIDFGKGVRPHLPVMGPKNGLLYVSTELNRSISIIDPATLKIIGSVPTGQEQSHMFAITATDVAPTPRMWDPAPYPFSILTHERRSRSFRSRRKFNASRFPWTTAWLSLPT